MKTLIINGKPEAAGQQKAMVRTASRIIKKRKLENPVVSLTDGIVFSLEEKV